MMNEGHAATANEINEGPKHTPTPWSVHREFKTKLGDGLRFDIAGADASVLVATTAAPLNTSNEEARANAHLIAAAPELLAALLAAEETLKHIGGYREANTIGPAGDLWRQIHTATNKALGKE